MSSPRLAPVHKDLGAALSQRLTDFGTGKSNLQDEHVEWLNSAVRFLALDSFREIYIFGFASKLGFGGKSAAESLKLNERLSYARASSVIRFLERANARATTNTSRFLAYGSEEPGYDASETDNSWNERAVEVHIFTQQPPPVDHKADPPCPGGTRYLDWGVYVLGGVSGMVLPGAMVAVNLVAFMNQKTRVVHWYGCSAAGVGASYSGPTAAGLWKILQIIFGNTSLSVPSWSWFTARTPFNFFDLDGATCTLKSVGGGVGIGYSKGEASVSGKVWFRESSGKCMMATKDFFIDVDTSGKGMQFGVGGSAVGGPLVRFK